MPRPMRLRSLRPWAGFSDDRLSCSAILDPHEVTDLPQHACEDWSLVVLDRLADLAQAERAERAAFPRILADRAACLCDSNLCHLRLAFCRGSRLRRLLHRLLRSLFSCFVGKDLRDRQAAHLRHLVGAAEILQAVDCRL